MNESIVYTNSLDHVTPEHLHGFFVDWPNPPSAQTHLRLLKASRHVVLALNKHNLNVVGFITAISDGVLCAYIPLLEVLPSYQGQGIGTKLVEKMLDTLNGLYMIDLLCDQPLQNFYQKHHMEKATGMIIRNRAKQSGAAYSSNQVK
ncbi:MAG TPA: GNAT family N-acetyltransferase [Candidatus Baltobacteraceae bacterium]|jgi:ribosomal protein S18 acetylase RimI-like enzyme|nr:GNAT family N-acetyltransferase [Candidatus Baltobacteraceae bacterium]